MSLFNRNSYDDKGSPIRQFVNVQDGEGGMDGASGNAAAINACYLVDEKYPGMGQYAFDFMMYGCGDSIVKMELKVWIVTRKYLRAEPAVCEAIFHAFAQNGIKDAHELYNIELHNSNRPAQQ